MTYKEVPGNSEIRRENSPFLTCNPEDLITPKMRRWIDNDPGIAIVGTIWYPLPPELRTLEGEKGGAYGGAENVILEEIMTLRKFGVKHIIVFGHPANKVLERFPEVKTFAPVNIDPTKSQIKIKRTDPLRAKNDEGQYVLQAYETIVGQRDKITVVHDHTDWRIQQAWAAQFQVPVMQTLHGALEAPHLSEDEIRELKRFEDKTGLGFIAISDDQMSQMPGLNWIDRIYNGVSLNDKIYRPEKDNYIMTVGRVCREKGIHNAIQLAKALNVRLIIAGPVDERPESMEYFKNEVEPFIDNDKIIHIDEGVNVAQRNILLSRAKFLVMLNTWREPFGLVMPEAMASGTPVLGSNLGAIPEVVGEGTGFVANSMDEAIEYGKRLMQGDFDPWECRKRVEQNFSPESMVVGNIKAMMKIDEQFNPSLRYNRAS